MDTNIRGSMSLVVIATVVAILLGGGGYYYINNKADEGEEHMMEEDAGMDEGQMMEGEDKMNDEGMMEGDGEMMKEGDEMMEEDGVMNEAGSYEAYSSEKLARANGGDVVLFFRASWCPTCRALDSNIRANLGGIPAGLTILDVDYDNSSELKQKYGVTYQHTFVQVDANGNLLKKWSGSPTLSAFVSEVI